MKIKSYAKINLSLDVLNKRKDGYHDIDTIMAYIDLHDTLSIEENNTKELILSSNNVNFPTDHTNLIYQVWNRMKEITGKDTGYSVYVDKKIPIAAGLAGGTSNAVSFMQFLIKEWSVEMNTIDIKKICESLGADFYFFFQKHMVRATGIGSDFVPVQTSVKPHILIVNNGEQISTKYVYDHIELSDKSKINQCVKVLKQNEVEAFRKTLYNTMQRVVAEKTEIQKIIDQMIEMKSYAALMSGSGPTVFGFFEDKLQLDRAYLDFKNTYPYVYMTRLR